MSKDQAKDALIEVLMNQVVDLSMMSKIELGDDVIAEIKRLKEIINKGGVAIVLITTYHFYKSRAPHWVVVTAYDDGFVYIHDPDQEWDHDTVISRVHVPIPEEQFVKICRWGKSKSAATVVLYKSS